MSNLMGKAKVMVVSLTAVLVAIAAPSAHGLTLHLSDGTNSETITDGGAGDFCPAAGCVTFIGTIGNFNINVTTGASKPLLGSPNASVMDLSSLDLSILNTGGVLTIRLTETDFSQVIPSGNALAAIGGTTISFNGNGGTVGYQAYLDPGNNPFGTTTPLASFAGLTGPSFSASSASPVATSGLFSLTQIVTVTHGVGSFSTSFDASLRLVPQPAALILIGSAMVAMVLLSWRKAKGSRS